MDDFIAVQPPFKNGDKKLAYKDIPAALAMSPAEKEDSARIESSSGWDDDLEAEMNRKDVKKDPVRLAILQHEKEARNGHTSEAADKKDDDFIGVDKDFVATDDFIPTTPEHHYGRDLIRGTVGAVDMLAGNSLGGFQAMGHAAKQGLAHMGLGTPEENPDYHKDVESWTNDATVKGLLRKAGVDEQYLDTSHFQKPFEAFHEHVAQPAGEFAAGIPHVGSPALGASVETGIDALPLLLGMKAGAKVLGPGRVAPGPVRGRMGYGPEMPEPPTPSAPPEFKWDGGAARGEKPMGDIQKTEANPNPIEPGMPRAMDAEGNFKPTKYDNVVDMESASASLEAQIKAHEAEQARISEDAKKSTADKAWEQFNAEKEAGQKRQYLEDVIRNEPLKEDWEPSQGAAQVEKIARPINNRSPMGRQRGAIDLSGEDRRASDAGREWFDPEQLAAARANGDYITDVSTAMFRKYGPQLELGRPDRAAGYDSIRAGKGKLPPPELTIEKIGDTWTVVDHDGRHRSDVLLHEGVKRMPVVIKDETGGFHNDNPKMIRSQDMETMVPNPLYRAPTEGVTTGKGMYDGSPRIDNSPRALQEAKSAVKNSNPNFGKFKQGGGISFGNLFGKDKPSRFDLELDKKNYDDMIYSAFENSSSAEQFKERLKLQSDNPEYINNVVNSSESIWADKDRFMENYKGSAYGSMDKVAQRASADLRPINQMWEEEGLSTLAASDDIGKFNKLLNVSQVMTQMDFHKKGGQILKNVVSLAQDYVNMGNKLYKRMAEQMQPYRDLGRKSMGRVTQAAIDFDGTQNDLLRQSGLMWPSTEMLEAKGLKPGEIRAYQSITKALDTAWGLIKMSHDVLGLEPPEQIPGYFPHFWNGSWKVFIMNETGNVGMKAFQTRQGANWFMNHASNEEGFTFRLDAPTSELRDNNLAQTLIEASQVYKNRTGLGAAMMKTLTRMDEYAQRGIIKEVLERDGIKGHLAEEGIKPDWLWNKEHNTRLMTAYDKVIEDVAKYWTNTHLVADVVSPINARLQMLENTPKLKEAITEVIGRATGQRVNHLAAIDTFVRELNVRAGLAPTATGTLFTALSRWMITMKLRVINPGFYAANIFQPFTQLADLHYMHQERLAQGLKGGDLSRGFGWGLRALMEIDQGSLSAETRGAVTWAKNNNKIDIYQADAIDPAKHSGFAAQALNKILDWLPQKIEERGRIGSFLMAYGYYKDIMPKREALEAAANRMDIMMGNYQRMHSPSMYSDYGGAGNALRPFALLRNVYFGKAAQAVQLMKDSPIRGGAVVGGLMAQYVFWAGATGVLGVPEYDALSRMINGWIKPDKEWPTANEVFRKSGMPQWMLYGIPSYASGIDISGSIGAPALTEATGIPAMDAALNFGRVAKEGYNSLTPQGANAENVYSAARGLGPTILAPQMENYVESKTGMTPGANRFDGKLKRNDFERNVANLTGKHAVSESETRAVDSIVKAKEQTDKTWKQEQVSKIVDAYMGITDNKLTGKLITNALESQRGFDAKSLRDSIKEEVKRRVVDERTRDLSKIAGSSNEAEKLRRMEQLNDLLR